MYQSLPEPQPPGEILDATMRAVGGSPHFPQSSQLALTEALSQLKSECLALPASHANRAQSLVEGVAALIELANTAHPPAHRLHEVIGELEELVEELRAASPTLPNTVLDIIALNQEGSA